MNRSPGHYRIWVGILEAMLSGPVSLNDIERKANVYYETIRPLMNELHKGKVVHISGWRKDSNNRYSIAVYQLGHGVDAKKPNKKSDVQRSREYMIRKLKSKEDKLFQPVSETLVRNPTIDHALRSWL